MSSRVSALTAPSWSIFSIFFSAFRSLEQYFLYILYKFIHQIIPIDINNVIKVSYKVLCTN